MDYVWVICGDFEAVIQPTKLPCNFFKFHFFSCLVILHHHGLKKHTPRLENIFDFSFSLAKKKGRCRPLSCWLLLEN